MNPLTEMTRLNEEWLRNSPPSRWIIRYNIRAAKGAKRALAALSQIFRVYCFGNGSEPKFAWTNVHLSPFFTKTRVDFARAGSVFPSLSWVRPT
jgi:hypothetical protein